jgi:DNA-binding response OmpR family regulator
VSERMALLLEDEALIAMDVEQTLTTEGFSVVSFGSCAAGLHWLEAHTPAFAVLDIELSDGECDTVAEILAAREIPFIVHSGAPTEADLWPAFSAGHWLPKPAASGELTALIRQFGT